MYRRRGVLLWLYARVRELLQQPTLAESMFGVAVLAVLVNLVELLCTAGLPAIYTSILVTLAVVTLSRRRLAERAGRWLKLVSGLVMLALGALLLLRPDWLP